MEILQHWGILLGVCYVKPQDRAAASLETTKQREETKGQGLVVP